jgi:predicted DNA-binding transcriptional regulator AlpA
MSTTPRRYRMEATSIAADISSANSTQPRNAVIAARVASRPQRRLRVSRNEAGNSHPQQLSLIFDPPESSAQRREPTNNSQAVSVVVERFANLDQRMTTTDVLRVVGVNRSTIFRWTKRGLFPQRHASGGWLRSDVEKWLAEKMESSR